MKRSIWCVSGLVLTGLALACSESLDGGGADRSSAPEGAGNSTAAKPGTSASPGSGGSSAGIGAGGSGGAAPLPPPPREIEDRRDFEAPRAGARYVYVANPRRNTVAVIDSMTLSVKPVAADEAPTYLRTIPGKDIAVVINVGSRTASILRTSGGKTVVTSVPLVGGTNALSIAPGGRHAIAWYDSAARGTSPTAGAGSYQDVSVVNLEEGKEAGVALTVGFRPSEVVFTSDGAAAFVVTDDGISIVRFAEVKGPMVAPLVRLGEGVGAQARDVSVTPDGKYAVARIEANKMVGTVVLLVDIEKGKATALDLKGFVTDLDMAPSGAFALAVQRRESTVTRIAIPGGFTDAAAREARVLEGETVASVTMSSDGKLAVLYTTADPVKRMVIADLSDGGVEATPVRLRKAVRSVVLAPDNRTALVVHTKLPGDAKAPGIDVDTQIDRAFGYSVVNLRDGFAKLQTTEAEIGPLAITPDASRAFVLLPDLRVVQRIHLGSFLVDDFMLGSPPQSIAALAESKRVFVSQVHAEGRISFIDWESGAVSSVTGFELNGRIVQ